MLTAKEKKTITTLFHLISDREETFTMQAFEGFMFGLAMTPGVLLPSEWLPCILGEEGVAHFFSLDDVLFGDFSGDVTDAADVAGALGDADCFTGVE